MNLYPSTIMGKLFVGKFKIDMNKRKDKVL